ncbi:hypothetical protein XI04_08530 [Bradyrhizobium sp. CCBAU 11430]|nr:hypothetical protein [Bradyrhizobium sp. CCBAU 11430]
MMPWNGQELQLQAIAVKGWRKQAPVHFVAEPLPRPVMPDAAEYTLGLLAGGFFAASDMPGFRGGFEGGSLAAETSFVMDRLKTIMDGLDVCYNDVIKVEGYYPYVNPDDWLPPAKERFRRFPEGAAVATGLPWPIPWPSNVRTKIELLGYRTQLGDYSKRVPRADSWPDWVWDWPVRNNFRQGLLVDDCVWLGGQIPFGAGRGNIQSPGDLSRQVDCTMAVISDILGGFNKRLDDLALLVCYYESDGSEESTRRFLDRLAMNIPGPLPPITLVPEPMVHTKRTTNEIWGVACA